MKMSDRSFENGLARRLGCERQVVCEHTDSEYQREDRYPKADSLYYHYYR